MDTQTRGKYGEDLAVSYLAKKGYEVVERNYRFSRGEVDLIAIWNNMILIFLEVKFRKNNSYGEPEVFVSRDQQKRIIAAAEHYLESINWQKDVRFDIISICGKEIYQIEDAFH